MDGKNLRLTLAAGGFAIVIFLILLWQPARQVQLHQRHLLRAVEKRDWVAVTAFLDPNYRDRWEHTQSSAVEDARQIFSQFLSCKIEAENPLLVVGEGSGTVSARLNVSGMGSPIAQLVQERTRTLNEPFVFKWVHRGWQPWSWALVEVDQPQLDLRALPAF